MELRVTKAVFGRLMADARAKGAAGPLAYLGNGSPGAELLGEWLARHQLLDIPAAEALEGSLSARPELRAYYDGLP